jgi:TonB family protein
MGLMEFLRQWQGSRHAAGIGVSVAIHLLLLALAIGIRLPGHRWDVKRGEPLIVELPRADDSPPPGTPGAPAPERPPTRGARATPAAPTPPAVAAPPAPKIAARPAARPAEPARPSSTPRTEPAPVPHVDPAPRVASAVTEAKPPEPAPAPPPSQSEPAPAESAPPSEAKPAEPSPPHPQQQVASLPPSSAPAQRAAPNILTALRRGSGGAGGSGQGHAGIEGEPIPLDSADPRFSDYLEQIRRRIKDKWGYPCEKNEATKECEYKSTQLVVEFGIAKNGELRYVTILRPSGHAIYDDYAVNAIKLANFPPMPDSFSRTGRPIVAQFNYILQSSLTNILR